MRKLILASGSPYRKILLQRLGIPFTCVTPCVNESRLPTEPPGEMVQRLARLKAEAAGEAFVDSLIIGSDQCAVIDDRVLGKPGSFERAYEQLKAACGNVVVFHTGLCLLDTATRRAQVDEVTIRVHLRDLPDDHIRRYLQREKPFDCAGSFKVEGLGIALISHMEGDDPNALIGLPMIRLVTMLEQAGMGAI